jgi:hypothetical protein
MKHNLIYSLIAAIFFLCNSCGLGSYPPENEGAMITPDGKKIVQVYSIFYCTQYKSSGNRVSRSGTKTYYVDIYDSQNGKKINKKSFKLANNAKLKAVTNKSFLTYGYNQKKNRISIEIYDIETGKLRFNDDQLKKLNNGLIFQYNYIYNNYSGKAGFVIKADDARIYLLDDISGKATLLKDQENNELTNDSNFDMTTIVNFDSISFQFKGHSRSKAVIKRARSKNLEDVISETDFIKPNLLAKETVKRGIFEKNPDLYYASNDWLILSKTKDNQDYEWTFTALDRETLKEKWSATLKNPLVEKKLEEIEQLYQSGNTLIIIGSQSINKLDLKSGKWLWNVRLTNEIY